MRLRVGVGAVGRAGGVVVAVLALGAGMAAATHAPEGVKPKTTYEGVTSQGLDCRTDAGELGAPCEIVLKTDRQGDEMRLDAKYAAPCKDGRTFRHEFGLLRAEIFDDGSFRYVVAIPTDLAPGESASSKLEIEGRFSKRGADKAKGTLESRSQLSSADGSTTSCTSPLVTFKAKAIATSTASG